jgi:thiamine-monophosphate kinase
MLKMTEENTFIAALAGAFPRSPFQKNALLESDAELITLPGGNLIAVTTDGLSEELTTGLYADPYLAGWMVITVNLSDLAAVGARPVGCLVSEVLPADCPDDFLNRLQSGIRDACRGSGTYILGGDTGSGDRLLLTGTAIGDFTGDRCVTRIGCRPGDLLYSTNLLGLGNAFALERLCGPPEGGGRPVCSYQPVARIREGPALPGCATSCMDTSDGVLATLDQLARLNHVGFEINSDWTSTLHPDAVRLARNAGIPLWLLLGGQHGEFELLFTVPPRMERDLMLRADTGGWRPLRLGIVLEEEVIRLPLNGRFVRMDTARLRNCAFRMSGNVRQYLNDLLAIDEEIQEGVPNAYAQF